MAKARLHFVCLAPKLVNGIIDGIQLNAPVNIAEIYFLSNNARLPKGANTALVLVSLETLQGEMSQIGKAAKLLIKMVIFL